VPGILRWGDLYDVCGLIAPRKFLAVNGLKDQLHSEKDIKRSIARIKIIYQFSGAPNNFQH